MAIKTLIALCLAFAIVHAVPKPEADADAEAYYGYYNRGYYGGAPRYYGGYRSYSRPSYAYKRTYYSRPAPAPVTYYEPTPVVHAQPAPIVKAAPVAVAAPAPVVAAAPAPAPAVVATYEEPLLKAFNAVPAVPEEHVETYVAPAPAPAPVAAPEPVVYEQPAVEVVAAAPQPVAPAAPIVQAAPQGVIASQYHAQDEFGNVQYGYSNPNSQKTEQRDAYGNVMGMYSYNDGTGYPKHVSYVADGYGFRITAANNLPVAPVAGH